jgi:hypothetical protein
MIFIKLPLTLAKKLIFLFLSKHNIIMVFRAIVFKYIFRIFENKNTPSELIHQTRTPSIKKNVE